MKRRAVEVYPGVTVDDAVEFGRPCVRGRGVSTAAIAARFKAGESPASLTLDYGMWESDILNALRWECLSRRQQLRRIEKARAKS